MRRLVWEFTKGNFFQNLLDRIVDLWYAGSHGVCISHGGGLRMLTSLHYFGHYRDFVLRNSSGSNSNFNRSLLNREQVRKSVISQPSSAGAPTVQLNKSYDKRVLGYIEALGENVVKLKDAARMYVNDVTSLDFEHNDLLSFESHLRWLDEDLRTFTASFNALGGMAVKSPYSNHLPHFTHSIRNITQRDEILLSHLGVVAADEGGLTYHGVGTTATLGVARSAVSMFKSAYETAREFLAHPMTHHLNFNELSYYYNYTIGSSPMDTFRLLESGLLIDRMI